MRPSERIRSAAFVAALVNEPSRGSLARWLDRAPRVVFALAAVAFVFGASAHDTIPRIEAEEESFAPVREAPRVEARPGVAGSPDELRSRAPEGEAEEVPGDGDVCGRNVCEFEPSCCEGTWDERCDRKLLEITRVTHHASPVRAGRCYWHDRDDCPGCACPLYLKRQEVLPRGDDPGKSLGYDGGTGCLRDLRRLLSNLKWMCTEGFCEE
ncbi:hypothetical protein [Polyangium sorediatum]|uniref:Uncharacterized protein n=1 Tax=Polyangium sorediatum TaxID=889274 RepID=A0ABT6NMF5_9BACT|nr:hypothetical protein [Polyangium sorediatum]MDI1429392.1 hypothetical protein [Polyangium sorediatum]